MQSRPIFIEQGSGRNKILFPDLNTLRHVNSIEGGTGGVHVCLNGEDQRFVLKRSTSAEHLKYEILANTIYARFNIPVPRFAVYKELPPTLFNECKFEQRESDLFVLAEYIEGTQPEAQDLVSIGSHFKLGFILDAFLRNRDVVKLENIIINKKGIYRIDNGSCLSFRALGEIEKDNPNHVTDTQTMRDEKYSPNGKMLYSTLTEEEINEQKAFLFNHVDIVFGALRDLHGVLKFQNARNLYHLFANRLNSIRFDDFTQRESKEDFAIRAAGIFIYTHYRGEIYALFGCRIGVHQGTYCSLGGTRDDNDASVLDTAIREVKEESNSFGSNQIQFTKHQLAHAPYRELTGPNSYRMYFAYHDYFKLDSFANDKADEYTHFCWLRLSDLTSALSQNQSSFRATLSEEKRQAQIQLYPHMFNFLVQTNSISLLSKLESTPPINIANIQQGFLQHAMKQRSVMNELKRKPDFVIPALEHKQELKEGISVTELALNHLLKKKTSDGESDVDMYFRTHPESKRLSRCKPMVLKAIQTEKSNPKKVIVYHAASSVIGVFYDLYSAIHTRLAERRVFRFRLNDSNFQHIKNKFEFYHKYDDANEVYINFLGNYAELCLSVNPTLLTEPDRPSSNCLELFLNNIVSDDNHPFANQGMADQFLARLSLTEAERQKTLFDLNDAAESIIHSGGRQYTIAVDEEIADEVFHPAIAGGKISPAANGDFSMVNMRNRMKAQGFNDELMRVQARFIQFPHLVTQPELIQVEYEMYCPLSEHEQLQYNAKILSIADSVVERMVLRNKTKFEFKDSGQFPLVRTYKQVTTSLFGEYPCWDEELRSIMLSQRFDQLAPFFADKPTFFEVHPDALEKFFLISAYNSLTVNQFCTIMTALPLKQRLDMIFLNNDSLKNFIECHTFDDFCTLAKTILETNTLFRRSMMNEGELLDLDMECDIDDQLGLGICRLVPLSILVSQFNCASYIKTIQDLVQMFSISKLAHRGSFSGPLELFRSLDSNTINLIINNFEDIKQLLPFFKKPFFYFFLEALKNEKDDLLVENWEALISQINDDQIDTLLKSFKNSKKLIENDFALLKKLLAKLNTRNQFQLFSFFPSAHRLRCDFMGPGEIAHYSGDLTQTIASLNRDCDIFSRTFAITSEHKTSTTTLESQFPETVSLWLVINGFQRVNTITNSNDNRTAEDWFNTLKILNKEQQVNFFLFSIQKDFKILLELLKHLNNPRNRIHLLKFIGCQAICSLLPTPNDTLKLISLIPAEDYETFFREFIDRSFFNWMENEKKLGDILDIIPERENKFLFLKYFSFYYYSLYQAQYFSFNNTYVNLGIDFYSYMESCWRDWEEHLKKCASLKNDLIKTKESLEEKFPETIGSWLVLHAHPLFNKQHYFRESELAEFEKFYQNAGTIDQQTKVITFINAIQNSLSRLLELLTKLHPSNRIHVLSYINKVHSILMMSLSIKDLDNLKGLIPSQDYPQFLNELSQFPLGSSSKLVISNLFGVWDEQLKYIMQSKRLDQLATFFSERPTFFRVFPGALQNYFLISTNPSLTVKQFCTLVEALPWSERAEMIMLNANALKNLTGLVTFDNLYTLAKTIFETNHLFRQTLFSDTVLLEPFKALDADLKLDSGGETLIPFNVLRSQFNLADYIKTSQDLAKMCLTSRFAYKSSITGPGEVLGCLDSKAIQSIINNREDIEQVLPLIRDNTILFSILLESLAGEKDDLLIENLDFLLNHIDKYCFEVLLRNFEKSGKLFDNDFMLLKKVLSKSTGDKQQAIISCVPDKIIQQLKHQVFTRGDISVAAPSEFKNQNLGFFNNGSSRINEEQNKDKVISTLCTIL